MKVKVTKWGDSLGVALPDDAVVAFGMTEGTELDLMIERGELRLRILRKTPAQLLEEMLDEMERLGPENEPETVDWGPDRGSEIIDDDYSRGILVPGPDGRPIRADELEAMRRKGQQNDDS